MGCRGRIISIDFFENKTRISELALLMFHEFLLPTRVRFAAEKFMAHALGWRGARLSLSVDCYRELALIGNARGLLEEIAQRRGAKVWAVALQEALDYAHSAILAPTPRARHLYLKAAHHKLRESQPLRAAVWNMSATISQFQPSSRQIDHVITKLIWGTYHLDKAVWDMSHGMAFIERNVRSSLQSFAEQVVLARNEMPLIEELDGW